MTKSFSKLLFEHSTESVRLDRKEVARRLITLRPGCSSSGLSPDYLKKPACIINHEWIREIPLALNIFV